MEKTSRLCLKTELTLGKFKSAIKHWENFFPKLYMNNATAECLKNSEYYDHENDLFEGYKIKTCEWIEDNLVVIIKDKSFKASSLLYNYSSSLSSSLEPYETFLDACKIR